MLERKHVAVQNNGIVRIKTTGERIGRVEQIKVHGVPGKAWRLTPSPTPLDWRSYREDAVEDVIRAYNEREGA